jgi:hypothetical protein
MANDHVHPALQPLLDKISKAPRMAGGSLTVYPEGYDKPGVTIATRDGFVNRCVSRIANSDEWGCVWDAQECAKRLNAYDELHAALILVLQHLPQSELRDRVTNLIARS